jgi:UDP:flavonoid glycosyltransferase YjiC (YdhE family)
LSEGRLKQVLIVPMPDLGHILPTLRVTRRLLSRGVRVSYLAHQQFKTLIEREGAHFLPIIRESKESNDAFRSGSHIWHSFGAFAKGVSPLVVVAQRIRDCLSRLSPDLVMLDHYLAIKNRAVLTHLTGISRSLAFSTSLFNWNSKTRVGTLIPTLIFCPEAFELPPFQSRLPSLHYVEASLFYGSKRQKAARIDNLIVVSFGSQTARYRSLFENIRLINQLSKRHRDMRFVCSVGQKQFERIPLAMRDSDNLQVVPEFDQPTMLSRARAFITHGGLGSIKESVAEAVPMIVMPSLYDQPFNAMRVRYLGIGEAVFPETRSIDRLDDALLKCLTGCFDSRLDALRETLLYLEARSPSQHFIDERIA